MYKRAKALTPFTVAFYSIIFFLGAITILMQNPYFTCVFSLRKSNFKKLNSEFIKYTNLIRALITHMNMPLVSHPQPQPQLNYKLHQELKKKKRLIRVNKTEP